MSKVRSPVEPLAFNSIVRSTLYSISLMALDTVLSKYSVSFTLSLLTLSTKQLGSRLGSRSGRGRPPSADTGLLLTGARRGSLVELIKVIGIK